MNSDLESSRKKRKRSSDSSSSSSRSKSREKNRSRSRDRKRSKKEKKEKRRRSRSKDKNKRKHRSKSKSSKKTSRRKEKRERSRSRRSKSESASPEKFALPGGKYPPMIPAMDPSMMSQYMWPVMPRGGQMVRPPAMTPMFYPPFYDRPVRHTLPPVLPNISSIKPLEHVPTSNQEQPPDKIVKDQNFLNSDEKLFESIVNNETHIRTIFEDTQISETYAGSTLFKTLKKMLHDPTTAIFESDKNSSSTSNTNGSSLNYSSHMSSNKSNTFISLPKPNEIVELEIQNYLRKTSVNKLSINIGDMTSIKEKLMSIRNRKIQNQQMV